MKIIFIKGLFTYPHLLRFSDPPPHLLRFSEPPFVMVLWAPICYGLVTPIY